MKAAKYAPADLNNGFVVAIEIVAKAGEEDAVGHALEMLIEPTMAEPGVKLFLPYRSPTNPRAFFIFELYLNEQGWGRPPTDRPLQGFRRHNAAASRKARARTLRALHET